MNFKSQLYVDKIINQRINLIEQLIHGKNLTVAIWGYGITGKSLLKWCLNHLSKDNRYIVIDKNKIEDRGLGVNFILESELSLWQEVFDIVLPSPGIILDRSSRIYKKIIPEFDLFYYFVCFQFGLLFVCLIDCFVFNFVCLIDGFNLVCSNLVFFFYIINQ